jgi:acyl-CoA thioester hydrolase
MTPYFHPITIRYNDLDPQGHVNNAAYLVYLEEARVGYIKHLGLWKGSFLDIGIIVADLHITYKQPVLYSQTLKIGAQVIRLGTKSMKMEHTFEDSSGTIYATAAVVLVAYDYRAGHSVPVPDEWRRAISSFESLPSGSSEAG